MSTIGPGDIVVKVSGSNLYMKIGTVARVKDLCTLEHSDSEECGLLFAGYVGDAGFCDCFNTDNFRKVDKADESFIEQVRACRPIKQPV